MADGEPIVKNDALAFFATRLGEGCLHIDHTQIIGRQVLELALSIAQSQTGRGEITFDHHFPGVGTRRVQVEVRIPPRINRK